jgi:hypothetical protein
MTAIDPIELSGGQWVTRPGGLRVWQISLPRNRLGAARRPENYYWDTATARRAHAAYVRGERDDRTREGERVYQRNRKRLQRERKAA